MIYVAATLYLLGCFLVLKESEYEMVPFSNKEKWGIIILWPIITIYGIATDIYDYFKQ
jgi:hypothetical protein